MRQRWIAPFVLCGRTLFHSHSFHWRGANALLSYNQLVSRANTKHRWQNESPSIATTTKTALFSTIISARNNNNMATTKTPIVVIVGAGSKHDKGVEAKGLEGLPPTVRWGLGGALPIPFAEKGFHVVLMGRRNEVLEEVAKTVRAATLDSSSAPDEEHSASSEKNKVVCIPCDVTDETKVQNAFGEIHDTHFEPSDSYIDCVVFNIAAPFPPGFTFGEDCFQPHQFDTDEMTKQHDIQVNGLIRVCKQVLPGMIERSQGCILLSGATMQLRGGARFGYIAPAKTALRALGQSMFQNYGPQGIHVCNMIVDGVIDSPNTRNWMPQEKLMNPYDIAQQYYNAYDQPPTVWSHEMMISPGFSAPSVGMRM